MNTQHTPQRGFGIVEVIIIVAILALAGFIGYTVYNNRKDDTETNTKTTDTSKTDSKSDSADEAKESSLPDGWVAYENKELGFTFAHPKDWTISNSTDRGCSPIATSIYAADVCPLMGSLTPTSIVNAAMAEKGFFVGGTVNYGVYQQSKVSLDSLYEKFKAEYASPATTKQSERFEYNGLKGFYLNQVTNSYSDNLYVIELAQGTYLGLTNRESETSYTTTGAVSSEADNTEYTGTVRDVIETVSGL